jgi:hypothetical protein
MTPGAAPLSWKERSHRTRGRSCICDGAQGRRLTLLRTARLSRRRHEISWWSGVALSKGDPSTPPPLRPRRLAPLGLFYQREIALSLVISPISRPRANSAERRRRSPCTSCRPSSVRRTARSDDPAGGRRSVTVAYRHLSQRLSDAGVSSSPTFHPARRVGTPDSSSAHAVES